MRELTVDEMGLLDEAVARSATAERPLVGPMAMEVRDHLSPDDAATFTDLLLKELPAYYDEVDETFPSSILNSTRSDRDLFGYFTLRKKVYAGYLDGRCAGFTVVTLKRGGSAKIGPTVTLPEVRRTGFASRLRDIVEQRLYEEHGVRKLYMTISVANVPALLFNLGRGYQVEGVLRDQYRDGRDELILGTFSPSAERARVTAPAAQPAVSRWTNRTVKGTAVWTEPSAVELSSFLTPRLTGCFDGLDESFYQAIIDACRVDRQSYDQKGKRLLTVRSQGMPLAAAVYVPKRGGSVKLSPCVADDETAARQLVEECMRVAVADGRRKIYAHVPATMVPLVELLVSMGFVVEAQLREAYKPGIDVLALGRLL